MEQHIEGREIGMPKESIEIEGLRIGIEETKYSTRIGPHPTKMPFSVEFIGLIITFTLGSLTSGLLSAIGQDLWNQIKKVYEQRKKKRAEIEVSVHITGSISFNCEGVAVKCDFDDFGDIHMDTLRLVNRFIEEHKNISDIAIPVQGPIQYKDGDRQESITWSALRKLYPV